MTPSTAIVSRKRKQPPTFQHLPVERAKKLKKDWVEKKKILSKWKHEKRKDGLERGPRPSAQEYRDESSNVSGVLQDDALEQDVSLGAASRPPDLREPTGNSTVPSKPETDLKAKRQVAQEAFRSSSRLGSKRNSSRDVKKSTGDSKAVVPRNSKEDLQTSRQPAREGPSQSSPRFLSKRDPSQDRSTPAGRERGRGVHRGRSSGTHQASRKTRQPDMRVKMGDLLEKIQKTYASQ